MRKLFVPIVLILVLCTSGAASAVPLEAEAGLALQEGWWNRLLNWFDRWVVVEGDTYSALVAEGCHLDPNGAIRCP